MCAALVALAAPAAGFHTTRSSIRSSDVRSGKNRRAPQSTKLHLTNEVILSNESISAVSTLPSLEVASLLTTGNIKLAFSVATFLPQIFWLFLILIVSTIDNFQLLLIADFPHWG